MSKSTQTRQTPNVKDLDKTDAVLLGLLAALRKEVFRTEIVKLTYLLDDLSFRNDYTTITGLSYQWDNYGPNAVGNEIVKRLDALNEMGFVDLRKTVTPQGSLAYGYRVSDTVAITDIPLSIDDWALIQGIVQQYGRMNRKAIVRASKQTLPMKNATQYELLAFQCDPALEDIKSAFWSDPELVAETLAAAAADHGMTPEELRADIAKSH